MAFDMTVTLGNVFQILTFIGTAVATYHAAMMRLRGLEQTLKQHAEMLATHALRLDRHEEHMLKLVGDMQRVIGRLEVRIDGGGRDHQRR